MLSSIMYRPGVSSSSGSPSSLRRFGSSSTGGTTPRPIIAIKLEGVLSSGMAFSDGQGQSFCGRPRVRTVINEARALSPVLVDRGMNPGGGARMARRSDREYREYLREKQRSQPGCPGVMSRTMGTGHPHQAQAAAIREEAGTASALT